jgi:hypothetical protein
MKLKSNWNWKPKPMMKPKGGVKENLEYNAAEAIQYIYRKSQRRM